MTKSVILAAGLLAFSAYAGNDVVIEGKVEGATAKSITAIDCNPTGGKVSRHAVALDSAGGFKTFVNIPFGHNFTIYYGGNFFCQYAEPGDSLHLSIDASREMPAVTYGGAHADFNNQYGQAYAKLFPSFYSEELPEEEMANAEYMSLFSTIHAKNLARIDAYADSAGLSLKVKDMLQRTALFSLANCAVGHSDSTPQQTAAFFADPLFGLDDPENLCEMMFPYHLYAYISKLEEAVNADSPAQLVDTLVARHPKSLNRDVMLLICLNSTSEHDGNLPQLSADLFADRSTYESIYADAPSAEALPEVDALQGAIYEWTGDSAVVSPYSNITELLKNEFAGKTVYLDLWATWCGPCIVANKSLPEVAEFFLGKDLVFVGVALKSNMRRWQQLVAGHPANCKDYIINGDDIAELIMSAYGMNGFPTFRIINADSHIIDCNPPRPNSPQLYDTLLQIIDNKKD